MKQNFHRLLRCGVKSVNNYTFKKIFTVGDGIRNLICVDGLVESSIKLGSSASRRAIAVQ